MKKLFVLLVLCGAASAASADDLDYTYLEGGFSHAGIGGISGHGYSLDGSFGLLPLGFFLDASRDQTSFDTSGTSLDYLGSLDLTRTRIHVGWEMGFAPGVDLVLRLGGTSVRYSQDVQTFSHTSTTGVDASAGIRAALPAGFEVAGDLGYDSAPFIYQPPMGHLGGGVDVDGNSEAYQIVALRYHVTDQFLLGLQYSTSSASSSFGGSTPHTWLLTARWNFL